MQFGKAQVLILALIKIIIVAILTMGNFFSNGAIKANWEIDLGRVNKSLFT